MAEPIVSISSQGPPARNASAETIALELRPFIPLWILPALALLLIWSVCRAYVRTTRRITTLKRVLLSALRFVAFALLLFCLARPVLVRSHLLAEKGLCFIALDSSASMTLRDSAGGGAGRTRWDAATAILSEHRKDLGRMDEKYDVQRYVFDTSPRIVARLPGETPLQDAAGKPPGPLKPAGTSTDLAALLDMLNTEAGGMSVAGAMLISDGRHNVPKDVIPLAVSLERAGVPLYVIGLGLDATPVDFKDIRISQVLVPEKGFIGSRMLLRVEIESTLPARVSVPLSIEVNGKKIHESRVDLAAGFNVPAAPVEVPFTPEQLGVHRVVANIGSVKDETNTANNTRGAFFRVYRTRLGIWYVEGAIRKEFGALRSALQTAPNVKWTDINAFMARTSTRGELLPSPEELAQLKLLIIGDLPAARFNDAGLRDVRKFVEDGGAVLMLGGLGNFGAGAWQNTPLADVFPVEMSSLDGMADGPLPIAVNEEEAAHPVLAVGDTPAQSAELWRLLPPMPGVNRVRVARPAARVLLRAGKEPLLVVQEYGKGRAGVFTGDTTWQWVLKAGQGETHKRFWRNLATWLTRSDYRDTDKAVFVDSERLQYVIGEEGVFHTYVHESEKIGAEIAQARISGTLLKLLPAGVARASPPAGEGAEIETPVFEEQIGVGAGETARRFAFTVPGSYRFRASAISPAGKVLDSDSVDLQVTAPDLEHDNPRANLKLLQRIAALSGGIYYAPEKAGEAFQALLRREVGYSKPVTDASDLWNQTWVLLGFVLLLSLEWILRKRWGLI